MNYTKDTGWYYKNGNDKSPSWTGVEYLYNFLVNNKTAGPYGREVNNTEIEVGDIAQLSFDGKKFEHTLIIVKIENPLYLNQVYIASHTIDSFNRPILSYNFKKIRFIHIKGIR